VSIEHPLRTVFSSGLNSGCQGCDPLVTGTKESDQPRLCSECLWSFPQNAALSEGLELLRARRRDLGLSL
jgi:hypothetical protein